MTIKAKSRAHALGYIFCLCSFIDGDVGEDEGFKIGEKLALWMRESNPNMTVKEMQEVFNEILISFAELEDEAFDVVDGFIHDLAGDPTFTKDHRRRAASDLMEIAKTDGKYSEGEQQMIETVCDAWKIPIPSTDTDEDRYRALAKPQSRTHALGYIYFTCTAIDGQIDQEEADMVIGKMAGWVAEAENPASFEELKVSLRTIITEVESWFDETREDRHGILNVIVRDLARDTDFTPEAREKFVNEIAELAKVDSDFSKGERAVLEMISTLWEVPLPQ